MRSSRDQIPLSFNDTDVMVAESISYLQENEPEEGYFVGFSGGKDSICSIEICKLAGVKFESFYSCTRIDPPEVVRFIKEQYPQVKFLFPSITFWDGIKRKMPPLRMKRWCCDVLKKDPGANHPLKKRVMGIRAEESSRRASRPLTDYSKKYKLTIYKPIFYWKEYHVWDFIGKNNIPYPELYDQGFHRIGCIICPFIMGKSPGKIASRAASQERWPGMWKAFESSCKVWFERQKAKTECPNPNEDFEEWYKQYLNGFE